ncbi:unnamed protein product [Prunus brigantina]
MVEMGRHLFHSMVKDYHIEPSPQHYSSMVDMLGRAGKLEEAEELMSQIPGQPGFSLLQSLLGACRIHGNVEMAERVADTLMRLEQMESGSFVLMSNLYAEKGDWEMVAKDGKHSDVHGNGHTQNEGKKLKISDQLWLVQRVVSTIGFPVVQRELRRYLRTGGTFVGNSGAHYKYENGKIMRGVCRCAALCRTKERTLKVLMQLSCLGFRFIYEDWFMPHTAAKLKFPYYWDEEYLELEPPPKDEL